MRGLGGRGFGTVVTWFLLSGDLYTAPYTFIAVLEPLIYGVGAVGFFAVPYTVIVFPIVFVFAPRLWSVSRTNNYVTPADFVRWTLRIPRPGAGERGHRHPRHHAVRGAPAGRHPGGASTVQGVGNNASGTFVKDLPLFIAFLLLAAFTFLSGLRAPALIAFVKDTLIYLMIIVAVLYIPHRLGGWGHIFSTAGTHLAGANPKTGKPLGGSPSRPRVSGPARRSPWARRWPCSCTRTRSPGCWPPNGVPSSAATWPSC